MKGFFPVVAGIMADVPTLQRQLAYSKKQTAFAWAQYFQVSRRRLVADHTHYRSLIAVATTDANLPTHIVEEIKNMAKEVRKTWDCPICLDMISPDENGDKSLEITNCGHYYCKTCLTSLKAQPQPKCAVCRREWKH